MKMILRLFFSNFGTKLVSVLVAIVLWFVVLTSRTTEITKEVPLEVVTATETAIASEVPERIIFRLSGPEAFLRAMANRRDRPIQVNLTTQSPGVVTYRFTSDHVELPLGVKVVSIQPQIMTFKLEHIRVKTIPVKLALQGVPPDGFKIVDTTIKPQNVKIRGPKSRVMDLTEIQTNPIDVSELRGQMEEDAVFDFNRYGVRVDGAFPKITIRTEGEVANFKIGKVPVRIRSDRRFKSYAGGLVVYIRAGTEILDSLDQSKIFGEVNAFGLPKGSHVLPVKISVPQGVTVLKTIPNQVKIELY
jgi:YbbR domain-containing protein